LSAAKQELFEESTRLKNQFKTLDDDEVDFLDSVLESTRSREEQVKKENGEQLEAFRKQREAAEKALAEENAATQNSTTEEGSWATPARKRRRVIPKDDDGIARLRKRPSTLPHIQLSSNVQPTSLASARRNVSAALDENNRAAKVDLSPEDVKLQRVSPSSQISPPALGLEAYSSEED
jgi:ATPase subunit of ABC transporter with duplicated ATPase domains